MSVGTLSRVQAAYLQHAARQLKAAGVGTRAVLAAVDRPPASWPPALIDELVDDIRRNADTAVRAGLDLRRIPPAPTPVRPPAAPTPAPAVSGTRIAADAPPLRVPDGTQLRTADQILAADQVSPFTFDGSMDSLRSIPVSDLADDLTPTVLARLEAAGLTSIWDLLMRIPRSYVDRSTLTPIAALTPGTEATFTGVISGINSNHGKRYVRIRITDGPATITCTFFNAMWMAQRFPDRSLVVVQGTVSEFQGNLQMSSPVIELLEDASAILIPIYPQTTIKNEATGKRDKELSTTMLRTATVAALQRLPALTDPIPADLLARRQVMGRLQALRAVHVPDSAEHAAAGRDRMAYDELLRLQLALGVIRNAQAAQPGITHRPTGRLLQQWTASLPYALTGAQQRALDAIGADLAADAPMNRLLMGDVGSGKTAVAAGSCLMAIEGGFQAALLAPTEILARQHYEELSEALTPLGLRVDLLVSKQLPRPRKEVLAGLADGSTHLVVGTHSILSDTVVFDRLGLVVIDEQHRFGVDQRALLLAKGPDGAVPDILQATATPIPRTSAITTYGDMEVVILDEKPAGRSPVETEWIPAAPFDSPHPEPWKAIVEQVRQGRQAFVVCSRVDSAGHQSETKAAAAATDAADELVGGALHGLRVAVAHGKQKPDERKAVMDAFKAGDIDVLVATTVIEVGVSVPNATVMVIMDATAFGLAQLHQIRGRVGRGVHPGQCWLVADTSNDDAVARMTAMVSTNDGFKLADMDLQIRGVGALTGTAQSGRDAGLRVADLLRDSHIHLAAREDARRILATDPTLGRHLTLQREVDLALGEDAQYLTRG
ncbi:ATP-dependent DNA helicase RecG [Gordonia phosphorivorans]|uniref:Probable DNA 3'-5' helicase RecG n=1 Tax=Gordonia phosphorivorans TaxID=1056982 RepID=A0ABV6H6E3_9ACTN